MKVLFDENVPHKLRRHFNQHNVRTAADMGVKFKLRPPRKPN
jgi:hypothetical protein